MNINIDGYSFEGPFANTSDLRHNSGVYVILDGYNNKSVIDVGQANDIMDRVKNHDRKGCWNNQSSSIRYAAYYTSSATEKDRIENSIRDHTNPPCGEK